MSTVYKPGDRGIHVILDQELEEYWLCPVESLDITELVKTKDDVNDYIEHSNCQMAFILVNDGKIDTVLVYRVSVHSEEGDCKLTSNVLETPFIMHGLEPFFNVNRMEKDDVDMANMIGFENLYGTYDNN